MWLTSDVKALISDTRIIPAIQYATQASIYAPENTAAELTTAQTVIISFLYALRQRDLPLIKKLLEVSSSVPQIKSTFLSVWLRDDFCFPRGDVAICLSTLGKLLLDGLQFPWSVAATLASLDVKYCIQECFTEADDTAGQILLSTMNASVSEGTQVNFSKESMSKESQTTLVKRVSFQLPLEKRSTGTQAGLIVHDRGVSVKPQQSTTGVQTTDHKMIAALNSFNLTSHSIYPTQKETTSIGTQAGLIVHDQGVSVKPEQSTTGVQTTNQNMGSTMKPSTLTSNSNHTIQKLGNDSGTENRQQNVVNAYRGLQNIPEDLFRSLQTTPDRSYGSLQTTPDHSYGSLPMLSQNQKKTPVSFNDYIFMDRELSFKPEQSTPPIQTIVASDKGSRIGTGILSQSMSANACGSLPMPKRNQTTATVVIDPKTGMDIFPDVLAEMRKQCKKDPAETSKTIAPRSYVYSSNLPKEAVLPEESGAFSLTTEPTAKVRDVSKYLVDTTVPVSSMNRPPVSISKGMANELMYSAIQKNDSKSIVKAINAGADVNDEGVMKKRPLHVAASAGRVELAIELIHWGADVNSLDNWEETPLFVASVAGHILMAEVLISAGANINHINRERNRPLHVAASAGQLEIVRLLLKSGADVDCKGESFRTPLHCAAFRGHLSVVGLLLEHGADPVAIEVSGQTPFSLAKSNQQNLVAEFLHYRSRF